MVLVDRGLCAKWKKELKRICTPPVSLSIYLFSFGSVDCDIKAGNRNDKKKCEQTFTGTIPSQPYHSRLCVLKYRELKAEGQPGCSSTPSFDKWSFFLFDYIVCFFSTRLKWENCTKPAAPVNILQINWISRLNLETVGCQCCIEGAGTESVVAACWMRLLQSIWCFSYLPSKKTTDKSFCPTPHCPHPSVWHGFLFSLWVYVPTFFFQQSLQNLKYDFPSFKMT